MRQLADGNYQARAPIESSDEFAIFGNYFNLMSYRLAEAKNREKWISKLKTSILAMAAHQLRTPINAIFWIFEGLLSGDYGKSSLQSF